ncbi:MAG: lipopolysaccharide biosynthesis protein [Candidatus Latescibacteria bacterium]|nr:lipopolysaccharide biosynthesis protein [Candidatus Latescibacterota bacterium]
MNLQQQIGRGLLLAFAGMASSRLVSFLADLGLMRLLAPGEFGVLALGLLVVNALGLAHSLGVGEALVVRRQVDPETCDTAFYLSLFMGGGLCALAWLTAPWMALLAGPPDRELVAEVLRWLSLCILFQALAGVPGALFDRALEFRKKFLVDALPTLVYALLAVGLAWKGAGVWSLVWGRLGAAAVSTAAAWALSAWRPGWRFSRARARELAGYGRYVAGAALVSFVVVNLDDALVVRLAGTEALGFYNRAFLLANLPATAVAHLANRVAFPAYARLKDQPAGTGPLCRRLLQTVGALSLPFALGLAFLAEPFTLGVLGGRWLPLVPMLQCLAGYGLCRAFLSNLGPLFNALGAPQAIFRINLLQSALLLALLVPLVGRWGGMGAALGVLAGTVLSAPMALWYLRRLAGPGLAWQALRPLWGPGAAMALALWVLRALTEGEAPLVQLSLAGGGALLVYGGLLWWWQPQILGGAIKLVQGKSDE